jgi:aminoglycoside/choline kinase family phosphotransferase
MFNKDTSPIAQIEVVVGNFKSMLEEYAVDFAEIAYNHGILCNEAVSEYMDVISNSPQYEQWVLFIEGIVVDCIDHFGMERWWVEACMGFELNDEIRKGYERAWKKIVRK